MITLAELLDQLRVDGHAYLSESARGVTVSNLAVAHAAQVVEICAALGWHATVHDAADNEWQPEQLGPELEPYRIEIGKPAAPADVLQILTNTGFGQWLDRVFDGHYWHVARLPGLIATQAILFAPWGDTTPFEPSPTTKSPRALVREQGAQRTVPDDIRPWLLCDDTIPHFDSPAVRVWANTSPR